MRSASDRPLEDLRVLVAEDEFFIADDLVRALRAAGAVPVGPASTVSEVEKLLTGNRLDAAILDINLRGQMAYEAVDKAREMQLPFLIVSGYSQTELPENLASVPRLEKPVDSKLVVETLIGQLKQD